MLYSLSATTSYGDVNLFLKERWQPMGALQALNGMLPGKCHVQIFAIGYRRKQGLASLDTKSSDTPILLFMSRSRMIWRSSILGLKKVTNPGLDPTLVGIDTPHYSISIFN